MTDSAPPEDAPPSDPVARPAVSRWAKLWGQLKRFRGPIAAIAGIGAIFSGLVGYWTGYENIHKVVAPQPTSIAVTADAGPLSIVVLPFQNLTGDANQGYVADGLTASLTADLSRIRDAFIIDAATAFAYKDKSLTAQQVGRELGVHFVLHGSVQRNGTKIRINAQLADATSNAQVWSESFEGDQSDFFALQDRVTTLVGNSIGREMVIVAARESEARKSSPKVADLMLRAGALGLKPQSLKNGQQMEDLYRRALALEPNNANALARLANLLTAEVAMFHSGMDESVQERKMVEGNTLALRAKELDPDNVLVYAPISLYADFRGDLEGGRSADQTRLSLEPKNPAAYNNLAVSFVIMGEPQRAIELGNQAINLNPKHPFEGTLLIIGFAYFMLGDNDSAIEWLQKSLEINPAYVLSYEVLAMAYALRGDDAKAQAAAAEVRRLNPRETLSSRQHENEIFHKSAKYKEWFESKFVPAWRKAGLPE